MVQEGAIKRTCILVLGMHRSGTSALSGVFALAGADGPATPMDVHSTNPKGFFESQKIWKLHGSILESAGSYWDDWRDIDHNWFESPQAVYFKEQAGNIINNEFKNSTLFVLKDPRICRLMRFWISVFEKEGVSPVAIHIHRNPLEVAGSLKSRNGFDPYYSYLLWLSHVLGAEFGSRCLPRVFTNFTSILNEWPRVLHQSNSVLGTKFICPSDSEAAKISDFLDCSLRHHDKSIESAYSDIKLPNWVRDSLSILERWAHNGVNQSDYNTLDEIRHQLTSVSPVFGPLLHSSRSVIYKLKKDKEELASRNVKIASLEKNELSNVNLKKTSFDDREEINRLLKVVDEQGASISLLQSSVAKLDALMGQQKKIHEERQSELRRIVSQMKCENNKLILKIEAEKAVCLTEVTRHKKTKNEMKRLLINLNTEKAARNEVYASTSWRITAPMRWLSSQLVRR